MHWWQIRKRNADLERELRADLDLEEEEQREGGLSPEDARYAARRAFGNTTLIREQTHEAWGWAVFEHFAQDLRFAFRQLGGSPGFTVTAVLILALGIGAVTAVFSLIDAALLKMLPVQNPERLVQFKAISPAFPVNDTFSYPAFKTLSQQSQFFDGVLAFRKLYGLDLEVDRQSGLANGQLVSGSYFSVLGVKAVVGRTILPVDVGVAGQNAVAVIGYDYWRSRFALDPNVVGKKVLVNNAPFTIVGVTEPEFYGLQPGARIDISLPVTTTVLVNPALAAAGTPADVLTSPFRNWLYVMARLQPGVTKEKAVVGLGPLFAQLNREIADALAAFPGDSPARRQAILALRLELDPASQGLATLREQFSRPLWIVMAVVAMLLLITCINVANLLLARAKAREKEFALRLAIGAAKGRLMRQLVTESILLGVTGGALGLALAYWGSSSLLALMAQGRTTVLLSVHPDRTVLCFALAISLLTALIFGTIPAWRATDVNPSRGLAQGTRGSASTREGHGLGKALVVFQVAISLVLVVGAGLLARSLANLRDFYPGFNRDNVLMFHVDPPIIGVQDVVPIYEQLIGRLHQLPGVRSVSLSVHEPLTTHVSDSSVRVRDSRARQSDDLTAVNIEPIGPDYFATLETPILEGREFRGSDRDGAPRVAIVNQSTAKHYFGDSNPVGRFVSIPAYRGDESWLQIVGVVRDIKVHDLREASTMMLYVPMFQAPEGGATFEVRTAMDPVYAQSAVLDVVKGIDSRLPIESVRTLSEQLDNSLVDERLVASLSSTFGLLALLLTCIGLYGLMAYTVNRRTGEIGVRMALGADRGRITRMVIGESVRLVVFGVAVGIPVAMLASRLIASQLFGLKPGDPVTLVAACALMAMVMITASWIPARRAASVDPMQSLRSE